VLDPGGSGAKALNPSTAASSAQEETAAAGSTGAPESSVDGSTTGATAAISGMESRLKGETYFAGVRTANNIESAANPAKPLHCHPDGRSSERRARPSASKPSGWLFLSARQDR
jgi:hypothetical protein